MTGPTLSVISYGPGYLVVCSQHGGLGPVWYDERLAGFGAIGHGTSCHSHPTASVHP